MGRITIDIVPGLHRGHDVTGPVRDDVDGHVAHIAMDRLEKRSTENVELRGV